MDEAIKWITLIDIVTSAHSPILGGTPILRETKAIKISLIEWNDLALFINRRE